MGLLQDTFDKLVGKVETTEKSYLVALEKKQVQLVAVQMELQAKKADTDELKKMCLLGEVSEATFDVEQSKLDAIEKKQKSILHDMTLIQQYKTADIDTVMQELKEANSKVSGEARKDVDRLRYDLMLAKQAYIQKMVDVSKEYRTLIQSEKTYQDMLVKTGSKYMNYSQGANEALQQLGIVGGGYEQLTIDSTTVYNALGTHTIPHGVQTAIKQGKNKGLITE